MPAETVYANGRSSAETDRELIPSTLHTIHFSVSNLYFSATPTALWFGIAALIAVVPLAFVSWKRSPHPRRTAALECLRVLTVLAVVLLLWQPEWRTIVHPQTKPRIALLWDDSKSMTTLDAALPLELSAKQEVVSRADWVKKAFSGDLWKPLEDGGSNEILTRAFSTAPADDPAGLAGTDLATPLEDLLKQETNLRAVVMFSDGDYNLGQPPVAAAQKLRLRGVPLFAIPVGSRNRLPDLDLLVVTAPTYGIVGENVQIPFTIRSSLDREVRTFIRLRDEAGHERTKDLILPPNAEISDSIVWKLEKEGSSTLELSIPLAEGERIETNNARKFTIAGKPEKIRVLVIETLPRWEYRYLRNALERDPGVEVSCLLFHPQLGKGHGRDYLQDFPAKPEELAKYDVVFLGDVGIASDQLTREQCELIRGLVENQASGVVFLPGPQGNQFTLADGPLGDLMPVTLDESHRGGFAESIASPLTLTSEGRGSLLTMLGDTEDENPQIWRRLPGFYWHAPVIRAKGGSDVLAVHGNRRGKFGPLPLLVTKTAGNGKVLFMGIDSAWRWRRGVEDLYHYRFWGQVARWMSYQRNMASGQRVRLYFTPERPSPGDTVTLNANAFDPNGAPMQEGSVAVDITSPEGKSQRLELKKNNTAWGAFSGRFKVEQPGAWKLRAVASGADDKPVETTLLAQGEQLEKVGQPARPEVLEEMARVTRGRVIHPNELADLVKEIRALPEPRPIERRLSLNSHWAVLTALIFLLGVFWTGRKLHGAF